MLSSPPGRILVPPDLAYIRWLHMNRAGPIQLLVNIDMTSSPSTSSAVNSRYFDSPAVSRQSSMTSDTGSTGRIADSSTQPPRTLVLCFDGTGDKFDEDVRSDIYMALTMRTADLRSPGIVLKRCAVLQATQEG